MNTDVIEVEIKEDDVLFECPYCLTYSFKLSATEYTAMKAGQQMIEVCQVCGKESIINNCRE